MNIGILPSVNFFKQKRAAKPGISVCSHIIRLMNNQKKPKKGYYTDKRRESEDKSAVAVLKIVPQLRCASQDSGALVSQKGKQSQGNPMQKVLGSIRRVRFTRLRCGKQVSGKRKDHRLETYKSNILMSEVPTQ